MLETGEYVDIRFQDEVRYKKPVGIYWLQAGVVKAAECARRPRRAPDQIWLYRIPSLDRRDRRGAADLLDGARVRVAPRRAARRADDGDARSCSASRRASPRPTRCCCSPPSRRWARWRAPISASAGPRRPGLGGWTLPAIFWTALAAGILLKGPLIVHVRRACRSLPLAIDRPLGALARRAEARSRPDLAVRSGAALVPRHHRPRRQHVPRRVGRPRSAAQGHQRAGGARRAARLLLRCCSG